MMFRRFFATFMDQQLTVSPDLIFSSPKVVQTFNSPGLESLSWLYSHTPCFPLHGDQIEIINEPSKFYETLVQKSAEAKERIVLASLYLGTGHLETAFVQTIKANLQQNDALKVNVLLDFTRGTRGEVNSKTMLMPLLTEFEKNVSLSMYHTPDLRGLTKRFVPPRWNELLGLQHMKVYLFDNSVMISGANLSNDYFTNRQDRYILIEDQSLADFYAQLVAKVQEFSLSVRQDAEMELHKSWSVLPYEGDKEEFMNTAKQRITDFFQDIFSKQKAVVDTRPDAVAFKVLDTCSYQDVCVGGTSYDVSDADTWIFPLIEMGQIGIHHDSIVTKQLLSSSVSGSRLKLATGYFNLTQDYMDTITNNCLAQCSILMAHPNANGFQGANGPAGGIPAAYTLIAKHFYENLLRAQQHHRVNFFEFEKNGWSYHAKGLWYYLPNSVNPNLTLIGSSNFGERSVNRDLETQVCLVTTNKSLQSRLQEEADKLYSLGSTAETEITTRPIPRWVQAVVRIFRNFF